MKIDILSDINKKDTTQLVVLKYQEEMDITPIVEYIVEETEDSCIYFKYRAKQGIGTKLQLQQFCEAIYNSFGIKLMMKVEHWNTAFIYLKRVLAQKIEKVDNPKVVIFLDETSWFDKDEEAGFLSSFGYFYNTFCQTRRNFLVILGSSNASWVDNKLRKDIGSLYQRLDMVISIEKTLMQILFEPHEP